MSSFSPSSSQSSPLQWSAGSKITTPKNFTTSSLKALRGKILQIGDVVTRQGSKGEFDAVDIMIFDNYGHTAMVSSQISNENLLHNSQVYLQIECTGPSVEGVLGTVEPNKAYQFVGGYTMPPGRSDVTYISSSNKLALRFGMKSPEVTEIHDDVALVNADWKEVCCQFTTQLKYHAYCSLHSITYVITFRSTHGVSLNFSAVNLRCSVDTLTRIWNCSLMEELHVSFGKEDMSLMSSFRRRGLKKL